MKKFRVLVGAALCGCAVAAHAADDPALLQPDPAGVVMPNITYNGWNYSPLDQITADNVGRLAVTWTWQIGLLESHEAPPLIILHYRATRSKVAGQPGTDQDLFTVTTENKNGNWTVTKYDAMY